MIGKYRLVMENLRANKLAVINVPFGPGLSKEDAVKEAFRRLCVNPQESRGWICVDIIFLEEEDDTSGAI